MDRHERDGSDGDRLIAQLYDELRVIAGRLIAHHDAPDALRATALVHEVYLKRAAAPHSEWNDQSHFRAVAARAARQVLIDKARASGREKRGGSATILSLDTTVLGGQPTTTSVLELEEAVEMLEQAFPRAGDIFTLRFYGGMTIDETARRLDLSTATVEREWRFARAWLVDRLFSDTDR
jgi:RNA polymerase sigma factor (TIGR02999 family)